MPARRLVAALALTPLIAACELTERAGIGFETPIDAGPLPTPDADLIADASFTPTVTWYRDIRPIIEARCLGCHGEAGIGSLDLRHHPEEWVDGPAWWAAAAADAILDGRMPPWMPEDGCRPIANDQRLDATALGRVARWRAERLPVGDPRDGAPTPPAMEAAPADRVAAGEGYVPDFSAGDDHRCRVVEAAVSPLFVQALGVVADQPAMVRRARVFAVDAAQTEALAALDAADPGPGFGCYGGPGVASELLLAWQPGDGALWFPATSAAVIEAGGRLVLQVQYDPAGLDPGAAVPVDHTGVALWLRAADDPPADRVRVVRHAASGVRVPAGEVGTSASDFEIGRAATVIGVVPQMHAAGVAIEASVVRADGEAACLVEIDDWQFDRQRGYLFPPEQWVAVGPDDLHRVRCAYDNRTGAAPITGGDGPGEEICADHLVMTVPWRGSAR